MLNPFVAVGEVVVFLKNLKDLATFMSQAGQEGKLWKRVNLPNESYPQKSYSHYSGVVPDTSERSPGFTNPKRNTSSTFNSKLFKVSNAIDRAKR